jgi:hypothetical protein
MNGTRKSGNNRAKSVPSYTYFIRDGEAIKIGASYDARWRLSSLQVGNPRPLVVLCAVLDTILSEEAAHKKFDHLRIQGEWFHAAPELLEFIDTLPKPAEAAPEPQPTVKIANALREPKPGVPLEFYQQHRALINQRNACADPVKREAIQILISQIENISEAGEEAMRPYMERQIGVIGAL